MVSFWGKKKDDQHQPQGSSHEQEETETTPRASREEPTERTRLIPRNNDQGYLSPDDPAVCSAIHARIG